MTRKVLPEGGERRRENGNGTRKDSQFERRRTGAQEKTTAEQLFRLRFQVSLGQNDGVKKLRQLRKEIAQIKTVARERELGIRGAAPEPALPRP